MSCDVLPSPLVICRLLLVLCSRFLFVGALRLGLVVHAPVFAPYKLYFVQVGMIFVHYIFVRLALESRQSILGVLVLWAPLCDCLYLVDMRLASCCLFGAVFRQGWVLIHLRCLVSMSSACVMSSVWICMNSNWQSISKSVRPTATLSAMSLPRLLIFLCWLPAVALSLWP